MAKLAKCRNCGHTEKMHGATPPRCRALKPWGHRRCQCPAFEVEEKA